MTWKRIILRLTTQVSVVNTLESQWSIYILHIFHIWWKIHARHGIWNRRLGKRQWGILSDTFRMSTIDYNIDIYVDDGWWLYCVLHIRQTQISKIWVKHRHWYLWPFLYGAKCDITMPVKMNVWIRVQPADKQSRTYTVYSIHPSYIAVDIT